ARRGRTHPRRHPRPARHEPGGARRPARRAAPPHRRQHPGERARRRLTPRHPRVVGWSGMRTAYLSGPGDARRVTVTALAAVALALTGCVVTTEGAADTPTVQPGELDEAG